MLRAPVRDAGAASAPPSSPASALFPLLGLSFFPRTDAGQFVINLKAPSGTRLERHRAAKSARSRTLVREVVPPEDLGMIVSNIGTAPGLLRPSTPPTPAQHTAFVQVSLKEDHKAGSYEYMERVQAPHRRRKCRS